MFTKTHTRLGLRSFLLPRTLWILPYNSTLRNVEIVELVYGRTGKSDRLSLAAEILYQRSQIRAVTFAENRSLSNLQELPRTSRNMLSLVESFQYLKKGHSMIRRIAVLGPLAAAILLPSLVFAHSERPTSSPARPGPVPNENRTHTNTINVCKTFVLGLPECPYQNIQDAVNAAADSTLIQIYPGLYEELPSRAASTLSPDGVDGTYTYQHHIDYPNSQNLIAVIGKKDITLQGMGDDAGDVVISVKFKKHVGIRGDRSDGIIIRNLSVYHAFDHGVYVLDTDGFIIDNVIGGYSREYDFLTFAVDHAVIKNCVATGAGDAGIYPGGTADTPGRHSVEVANCKSYHNVLGYSGTQGNYVWVHDNQFYDNAIGLTSDSETDHPNYPQKGLIMQNNKFYDNNFNVYSTSSDVKATVFEGEILLPVGTGAFLASGNENTVSNNYFWSNQRYGLWLASGQAIVLGPTSDPAEPPFVSSGNVFTANIMNPAPGFTGSLNAIDFGWDGLGVNNCWSANTRSGYAATSDALILPPCGIPNAGAPNPANLVEQAALLYFEGKPGECWIGDCVWGPGPTPTNSRNLPEGWKQEWVTPTVCGPSTCFP